MTKKLFSFEPRKRESWEVPLNLPRGYKHHEWLLMHGKNNLLQIVLQDTAEAKRPQTTAVYSAGLPSLRAAENPLYGIVSALAPSVALFELPAGVTPPHDQPTVFWVEYAAIHRVALVNNDQNLPVSQR